jgi:dihydropteroate synthase
MTIFKVRDKELDLSRPVVMGILNATPDSFSDGGKYLDQKRAMDHIARMVEDGAKIIDIGGESTRPGSDSVSEGEEMDRVIPIIEKAVKLYPDTLFSVDTTKYRVADQSLQAGVHIVNDVSGLKKEPRFAQLCAVYRAGYVLMHSQGDPKTMQKNPVYDNVIDEINLYFTEGVERLLKAGVTTIMIDPGIGFGKTLEHNLTIIKHLKKLARPMYPLLVGASRKSMIGQLLNGRPSEGRLAGTIALHYHALLMGTKILRVHDVKEAMDSIKIFQSLSG